MGLPELTAADRIKLTTIAIMPWPVTKVGEQGPVSDKSKMKEMTMKTVLSRRAAILLTLAALLSELWRGFLDAMFVLPVDFADPAMMNLAAVIFTALFAGWGIALAFSWQGSQRAMAATFLINLLVLIAVPLSWLFFYCPAACRAEAGVFNLANSLNLVLGGLAAIALGFQLFGSAEAQPTAMEAEGARDAA